MNLHPKLSGLILCGGKSRRMGRDKFLLKHHGEPQWSYLANLLTSLQIPYFLSCSAEQLAELPKLTPTILDQADAPLQGPARALYSAHYKYPQMAFLVIACDLLALKARSLEYLLQTRMPASFGTIYYNPKTEFAEPLCAIWESQGLAALCQESQLRCPNQFILNRSSQFHLIPAKYPEDLENVNYPQHPLLQANAKLNDSGLVH